MEKVAYNLSISRIPKPIILLISGGFIQSLGNSLMWPLNSIFMHNVLHRSLTEAGLMLALQSLLALLGQFASGFLVDRFGPLKIMRIGLIAVTSLLGLIAVYPRWEIYAPAFVLLGLAQANIMVPLNTMVPMLWPEGQRQGYNFLYVANNAGVAVGTALGGLVAQFSFRLVFSLNAGCFFVYLGLVIFGARLLKATAPLRSSASVRNQIWRDPGFRVLLALMGGILLYWSAYVQWMAVLPVVMNQRGFSLPAYSSLWTLNGVFIVVLQPVVSWVIRHWAGSYRRQFYLASVLTIIPFVILFGHLPYVSYVVGMLILTVAEMLILPSLPAAAAQLAPDGKGGQYQGMVGSAGAGGRMLGPLVGGAVFDRSNDSMVWLTGIGFMVLSIFSFNLYSRLGRVCQHTAKPAKSNIKN